MHKLFKPGNAPENYNFEEWCPHCDSPIPVIIDDSCFEYAVTCPVCDRQMMLCTLCRWDFEDDHPTAPKGQCYCDWSEKDGCYRSGSTKHRT